MRWCLALLVSIFLVTYSYGKSEPLSRGSPTIPLAEIRRLAPTDLDISQGLTVITGCESLLRSLDQYLQDHRGDYNTEAEVANVKAQCYDRMAESAKKYDSLRLCADLKSSGDKEKAAGYLFAVAGQLSMEKEVSEACSVFRAIIRDYPCTRAARSSRLRRGDTLRLEGDFKGSIAEYSNLVRDCPGTRESEMVDFRLLEMGITLKEVR
jgi:hypothetical protein